MSWLNNLKFPSKILIAAVLSAVAILAISFASLRMKHIGEDYSSLISSVGVSATLSARAGGSIERSCSSTYKLAAETSEAGNAMLYERVAAGKTQYLTTIVAAASEDAPANVQSVASTTEEMSSSVNEIGRQVQEAARIAADAVNQAAKSTDEMGARITSIQSSTQESVTAIKATGGTIDRVSETSSTIAAAIEEQGAATKENFRNVQQAVQAITQVASIVIELERGATKIGSASSRVLSSAAISISRMQLPQKPG